MNSLDQLLALLNAQAGDRYLFSGRATDTPAVETLDHIMNGDGARAGLKQLISERNQADLGADGRGRLTIGAGGPNTVQIDEQVTTFGFKLGSITSNVTGATTSGPTGSPASMSIDFSAAAPNPGETVTVRLNLPDGTSENLTLTATTDSPPGANEFTIGATVGQTATNFQTALTTSIENLGASALTAASAVAASSDFFNADVNNPPTARGRICAIFRRDRHGGRHDRKHGDLVHRRNRQRPGTFDGDGTHRSVLVGFLRRAGQ